MQVQTPISHYDRAIYRKDVLERIVELAGDADAMARLELAELEALDAEAFDYSSEWHEGKPLIRDAYFTEYAQELAYDIGLCDGAEAWPLNCIDWGRAADELSQDYAEVDFRGHTFLIRMD